MHSGCPQRLDEHKGMKEVNRENNPVLLSTYPVEQKKNEEKTK